MRVLALEPFYAGSHRQFLDGWIAHSEHEWTVLGLPGHKWKWRMRHAPITFASDVANRFVGGAAWDVIFASDMLNLGEFLSLLPNKLRALPTVIYFHENQFTYPNRTNDARDLHFAFTNFVTALTADRVWFNSQFHQDDFLNAASNFLRRMPDHQELDAIDQIRSKSAVQYPGVRPPKCFSSNKSSGPLTILWSARWEHDKNPAKFFAALESLQQAGIDFQINVLGESFSSIPPVFTKAEVRLADKIRRWGYVERDEYLLALQESDVVVSTADHEYFGISVVEAVCSGVYPLLPNRLSYPELLARDPVPHLYNGDVRDLVERLAELSRRKSIAPVRLGKDSPLRESFSQFHWQIRADDMDKSLCDTL